MREDRILELARIIRSTPHGTPTAEEQVDGGASQRDLDSFNMNFVHCGSAGCISGWAHSLWTKGSLSEILGLDPYVAEALYLPSPESLAFRSLATIQPYQAATVLERVVQEEPQNGREMQRIWSEVLNPSVIG